MNIAWPEAHRPTQLTRTAIEDALGILDVATGDFTITRYPCLLMTPIGGPIYFGDTLLIAHIDGTPVALARQVYKRHIMSVTNRSVAERLIEQAVWLRQRAQHEKSNESVHPVYFMFPESGFYSLAVSSNRHRNVRYVVRDGDERQLQPVEELRTLLTQRIAERIAAIDLALLNRPVGFDGLPA